jgi:hypothetical protein
MVNVGYQNPLDTIELVSQRALMKLSVSLCLFTMDYQHPHVPLPVEPPLEPQYGPSYPPQLSNWSVQLPPIQGQPSHQQEQPYRQNPATTGP